MNEPRCRLLFGMWALCIVVASCSAAATDETAVGEIAILALGDSVLGWNAWSGESIPEVIGEILGRPVINAAAGGAHLSHPERASAADGLDIRGQYFEGDWDWVVLDGGGNDLHDDCGCEECGEVLDDLVSADGRTGEIPEFVSGLIDGGTQVMLIGYYAVPSDAEFGFDRCVDEAAEHGRRLQAVAAGIDGVWFVSAGDVISPENTPAYASDLVHPSPAGSRLVGEYVAAAIENAEGEQP